MISRDEALKELSLKIRYFEGNLYWIESPKPSIKIDTLAGCVKDGRRYIKYKGFAFLYHRVIYFLHHGYLPNAIDHIDGNPLNNTIENLRACLPHQNSLNTKMKSNNTSGVKNVYWSKTIKRWVVRLRIKRARKHMGSFENFEEAAHVAQTLMKTHYGEWLRK